jgi:hypothetical protein
MDNQSQELVFSDYFGLDFDELFGYGDGWGLDVRGRGPGKAFLQDPRYALCLNRRPDFLFHVPHILHDL